MTIGYSSAGGCWPTLLQAQDAYYGAITPTFLAVSGSVYLYQPIFTGGGWKMAQTGFGAATSYGQFLPAFTPGSCELEKSPGYPATLTGSTGTGTGSGTVTGTVSIAPYDVTYDYAAASAAFMTGLSMVLMFWLAAKPIGTVLNAIKRW